MRTSALFLILFLAAACKKEDPKPAPTPAPVDYGTRTPIQLVCQKGFEARITWDNKDTLVSSTKPDNDITIYKWIKGNTITLTGKSYRSLPDTTKLRFRVTKVGTNVVDVKDTVFTARTFTLW